MGYVYVAISGKEEMLVAESGIAVFGARIDPNDETLGAVKVDVAFHITDGASVSVYVGGLDRVTEWVPEGEERSFNLIGDVRGVIRNERE